MADSIFLILLAALALLGLWMVIDPRQYLVWLKAGRPSLGIREDDPHSQATVRVMGVCVVGFSALFFVALLGSYRK